MPSSRSLFRSPVAVINGRSAGRLSGSGLGPLPTDRRRDALVRARLGFALDGAYADVTTLEALTGQPVLVVANHVSALDAALAMSIAATLGRKLWLAAAPVVLERHPWLRRFGLFTVQRGAPLETTR